MLFVNVKSMPGRSDGWSFAAAWRWRMRCSSSVEVIFGRGSFVKGLMRELEPVILVLASSDDGCFPGLLLRGGECAEPLGTDAKEGI